MGRMWSAKRPGNTMIESYAIEPQINRLTASFRSLNAGYGRDVVI